LVGRDGDDAEGFGDGIAEGEGEEFVGGLAVETRKKVLFFLA